MRTRLSCEEEDTDSYPANCDTPSIDVKGKSHCANNSGVQP